MGSHEVYDSWYECSVSFFANHGLGFKGAIIFNTKNFKSRDRKKSIQQL